MDIKIKQLSNITGVTPASIRRYAELGLVGEKIDGDIAFDHADIHSLKIFKLALSCGYSVQSIIDIVASKNRFDTEALNSALNHLRERQAAQEQEPVTFLTKALGKLEKELEAFISAP